MRAIGRAIDGDFALLAAALWTDFAVDAGTMTACTPFFAEFAGDVHRVSRDDNKQRKEMQSFFPSYRIIGK